MRYLSIDLETTGLDSDKCQILEIAAILDDGMSSIGLLPVFHRLVYPISGLVKGQLFALHMNADIIKEIHKAWNDAKPDVGTIVSAEQLPYVLGSWISKNWGDSKVVAAGKNLANFDMHFLRKYEVLDRVNFHHRIIDPGMYYHLKHDTVPPDTKTCLERAGLSPSVKHRAYDDAMDVIRLIRKHHGIPL